MSPTTPTTATPLEYERPAPRPARPSIVYLDVLRAAAIALVVLLHVASGPVHDEPVGTVDWWAGCFYDAVARCCVPLFVMISGALMLDPARDEPLGRFFRKRVLKVVVPLVFWSLVYVFVPGSTPHADVDRGLLTPVEIARAVFAGPVFYHLWFVYVIVGLYIATPILRAFLRGASARDLHYFMGAWLVVNGLFPLAALYLHFKVGVQVTVVTGFVGYFILGHLLRHDLIPIDPTARRCMLGGGLLFTFLATAFLSRHVRHFDPTFFEYMAPNVVAVAIAAFLLARDGVYDSRVRAKPVVFASVAQLSSTSWGVYLLHPLVMAGGKSTWGAAFFDGTLGSAVVGVPLAACTILAITTLAVIGLRQVPGVRFVLP